MLLFQVCDIMKYVWRNNAQALFGCVFTVIETIKLRFIYRNTKI